MRKVMTRTQLRPIPRTPAAALAPVPKDTTEVRREGRTDGSTQGRAEGLREGPVAGLSPLAAAPPRRPGGSIVRAAAPGGRPPGSPGRSSRGRTRPADTRPPSAGPGRTTGRGRTGVTGSRAVTGAPVPGPGGAQAAPAPATPLVPAQAPRRPLPQLQPTDRFAELLLGVLSGRRPVHSMLRHTAGRAYDELARLAERGPLRTRGTLPVVRDIGYFEPRPGALEVFARIGAGDQLRAMAFRLEQGQDLRWRCTAVELGGPRRPHPADD
ncbi:Rv3235 family protein [Streptomyces sp. AC627_RSS907]|uniref:Rv3235 family protein n=1 Tax=Streptomyces sp. AC627_RSS907 TaxID=2823684 RepID=UPI001C24D67F|nr:Rv3235 family protein [Streptomyces sp. AC627_RSS907]